MSYFMVLQFRIKREFHQRSAPRLTSLDQERRHFQMVRQIYWYHHWPGINGNVWKEALGMLGSAVYSVKLLKMNRNTTNPWLGLLFAWMTASMWRGMEICWGLLEAQDDFMVTSHMHRCSGVYHHSFPKVKGQASLLAISGHWTSVGYLWQCWWSQSPDGTRNQHPDKACGEKDTLSALKYPGRCLCWLWTTENPEDQNQQKAWHLRS